MNRFNNRRNPELGISQNIGNNQFYLDESLPASTSSAEYRFLNETGQDLLMLLSTQAIGGYRHFTVLKVYGHLKKQKRVLLYDLPNIILASNLSIPVVDCGLPLPGIFDSYSIVYTAASAGNFQIMASPITDFFNSRTSILNFYINQTITALGNYSGGFHVPDMAKFLNFSAYASGAYSKDVKLQYTIDGSVYHTLDSKLATLDLYANFEFVVLPAWRSVSGAGLYTERRIRYLITNNDVTNSIALTHLVLQFLF